jgi:hypothetical protein
MARLALGVTKTRPSGFPRSGTYFYGNKLICSSIQDTAATKFSSLESSSTGASFDVLLPDQVTNAWAMGPFVDDAPVLFSLGRMVRAMDTIIDALSPKMTRTYSGFWSRRLLHRR